MNDKNSAIVEALGRIGVTISLGQRAAADWGWAMQNAKIIRDWEGPYPTAAAAAEAALAWLLEHARKGLLCHHLHPSVPDAACEPIDGTSFSQEAWYNLN